ncbi:MAG: hypothetical protein LQ344_007640 [Seirophora lacunosa]|nr:MAG: hypothetical protein LQ344_007640 [Seirophora lacunosa]
MRGNSFYAYALLVACLINSAISLTHRLPTRDVRTGTGAEQYDSTMPVAFVAPTQLDRVGWTATANSFQPGCEPRNVLDNTGATWWESRFSPQVDPLPHNIVIDMKNSYVINGFRMLPRQDRSASGNIGQHTIEVSLDSKSWKQVASGTYANDQARKTTYFQNIPARYVRLTAQSTAEGKGYQYVTVGEIDILSGPDPTLPRDNWKVTADSENPLPNQHRAVEATDGASTTYWSTQFDGSSPGFPHTFTIDQGSDKAVSGLGYLGPPTAQGRIGQYTIEKSTDGTTWTPVTSGTWTDDDKPKSTEFGAVTVRYIRLTALSEAGNRGPWAAAAEINLFDGSRQATFFSVTVDSQETSVPSEDGQANNALDGDPDTFWTTKWANTNNIPGYPHFFRIDMKASYSVHGLSYLPRQTPGNLQGNVGQHLIEVSLDGTSWTPVARGTWEDDQLMKVVNWEGVLARYLRLTALTEAGNRGPWAAAAEIQPLIQSTYSAPAPESQGQWGETIDFPLVPVAVALVPSTSEVLVWSAWNADKYGDGNGRTVTATYTPSTGIVTQSIVTNTQHDMFCPGISISKSGLIVVSGGNNAEKTSVYHPDTHSWSSGAQLVLPRGYNSQVTLSNGGIFTTGGSWGGARGGKNAEYYDPVANTWTLRPGCPVAPILTDDHEGIYRQDNHAWLFARQNGSVFHAGPSKNMNWFSTDGPGTTTPAGTRANDVDSMNGVAVMYDAVAGKILTVGGALHYDRSFTTANAHIITLGAPNTRPTVTAINSAHYARAFHNSVVLPDGRVLIVGGLNYARVFSDDTSILYPELFDPATNTFTVMAPLSIPRNYHSVAVLLPDGTVFSGGGGLCGVGCTANHYDAQIFRPPYLFNSDGTAVAAAARPKITRTSPARDVPLGSTLTVTTEGPVEKFAMVRFGTATHSVNTDQLRVPLTFTAGGANTYRVQVPSEPGVAVPGWYMLFAMDAKGVPSVAATINVQ